MADEEELSEETEVTPTESTEEVDSSSVSGVGKFNRFGTRYPIYDSAHSTESNIPNPYSATDTKTVQCYKVIPITNNEDSEDIFTATHSAGGTFKFIECIKFLRTYKGGEYKNKKIHLKYFLDGTEKNQDLNYFSFDRDGQNFAGTKKTRPPKPGQIDFYKCGYSIAKSRISITEPGGGTVLEAGSDELMAALLNWFKSNVHYDTFEIKGQSIEAESNTFDFSGASGKYLELHFGQKKVSEVVNLLGSGRIRKDQLFMQLGDWKDETKSGITFDSNTKAILIPDSFNFKSGFKYTLGKVDEVTNSGPFKIINNLAGAGAQIDAISQSLKQAGDDRVDSLNKIKFSERVNRYRNVPYFKDIDNVNIDSLSFTFNYGQFGLYNCLEEVVKPILKLAGMFSYKLEKKEGDNPNTPPNYVGSGFDPKFSVMTKMYETLFTSMFASVSSAIENGAKPSIENLSSVSQGLIHVVNKSSKQALADIFMFNIGSSIYGPFYASDVSWEFDYTRTNKEGYPFSGSINISGIKSLLIETVESLLFTGGEVYTTI